MDLNPLGALEAKIEGKLEQLKTDVLLQARILVLKELTVCQLSRLATLDIGNAATYLSAIKTLG